MNIPESNLRLIALAVLFISFASYNFIRAYDESVWFPPDPGTPPANNVASPINTGTINQIMHSGLSVNALLSTGEIVGTDAGNVGGQFRMVGGNIGSFWRNDSVNTYFLLTDPNNQYGGYNALRPLTINNSSGVVGMGNGLNVNAGGLGVNGEVNLNYGTVHVNQGSVEVAQHVWSPQMRADQYCDGGGGNCHTAAGMSPNISGCHSVESTGGSPNYVATAYCGAGEVALNGGGQCANSANFGNSSDKGFMHTSMPVGTNGWVVDCYRDGWGGEDNAKAVVTCCPVK